MPRPEDDFTTTVEGAEAYEKWRADNDHEDFDDGLGKPDPMDVYKEHIENGHSPKCRARDLSECFCPGAE